MRIREYQIDKIDEARRIQQECLRLHLPCPPVLHWGYAIKEQDGEVVEIGKGKANSYTRNALNILAYHLGLAAYTAGGTTFGDGVLSYKLTSASIVTANNSPYPSYRRGSLNPTLVLSSNSDAESLDYYASKTTGAGTAGTNAVVTSFDTASRKLITTISRPYNNVSGSTVSVCSASIVLPFFNADYGNSEVLLVRDVFDAIAVANGQTITWTYTTEVAYPNP
jgi:hypothetical protein